MDKLEHYLNQVCRGIGGPRRLREHLRQELREHLLDAVAEHKAAGLSEEVALARALEDFGKPDEVRSELEGTHGQRILGVLIGKALEWKEMTMKAKWFWSSWAHLALAAVIVLEVLFITFNVMFIIPRFQKLTRDGVLDPALMVDPGVAWVPGFLESLGHICGEYATWLLLAAALAVALFEWRVRNDNKPFIRLSALGTVSVALLVVAVLMSAALVISFTLAVPAVGRLARPFALQQTTSIDSSINAIEQALAKKDWEAMPKVAEQASQAVGNLTKHAVVLTVLAAPKERATIAEENKLIEAMRAHLQAAGDEIQEAQQAISGRDANRLEAALRKFTKSYDPVHEAAKRLDAQ
jgi:hypothetical protein